MIALRTLTRRQGKTRDVITLFKSSSPGSVRVHNLLKQLSAQATETATEDQASDHSAQNKLQRKEFNIDVVDTDPTPDQLNTILSQPGIKISQFVPGANTSEEAMKMIKKFHRPTVCASTLLRS